MGDDVIGHLQAWAEAEFGDALTAEAPRLEDLTFKAAALPFVPGGSLGAVEVVTPGVKDEKAVGDAWPEGQIADRAKAAITQARRLTRHLNAFTSIDESGARAAAASSQKRQDDGRPLGPLDGMLVAYKDLFDRTGHCASFGSRFLQSRPAGQTADAVRRLSEAGTISIGALTMAEFALGPTGHNAAFGHCRNPWDLARISGGSSSGAGSAVAAGIVQAALGSDTGGSIRIPASCCGVVGLKPTQGRVSTRGVMPLSWSLDCVGPLARRVSDCAQIFAALIDGEPSDEDRRTAFTLAYPKAAIAEKTEASVAQAVDEAAAVFAGLGGMLVERPLPDMGRLHSLADIVQRSEAAAVHAQLLTAHREAYTRPVLRRIEGGLFVAAPAYVSALNQRSAHCADFIATSLEGADALLVPSVGLPVPLVEETDEGKKGPLPELIGSMTRWTRWLNYLGVPALSVPCGVDCHGMPVGLQLVGRPGSEFRLLALAALFERATPWHERRPVTDRME